MVPLDSGVSRPNFRVSGPIAWVSPYACILFPNPGVMNVPLLKAYSVNKLIIWLLKLASESAIPRARARPHTLAPPGLLPLTESGGEETRGALVLCG